MLTSPDNLVYNGKKMEREENSQFDDLSRYCVVGWTSTPMAGGGRGAGADHVSANTLPTNLIMMKVCLDGGCSGNDVNGSDNDQVHILQGAQVLGCPVAIHTHLQPKIREAR